MNTTSKTETETVAKAPSTATKTNTNASWSIDPAHTSVTFGVRHMMVSTVRGEFQKVSGTVLWDPARPETAKVEATIDVASIHTREAARDAHLKSADFFDADKFPTITFSSRAVGRKKDGTVEIVGDLTIRDVTRVITLEVEGPTEALTDPWGNLRVGASAKARIKRSEFGMIWNTVLEAGGLLVGDEISLQLDVELQQAK